MELKKIAIDKIKTFDFLKNIPFPSDLIKKNLLESIDLNGVQHPVTITILNNNYFLIDGYKRLKILENINSENIYASVINKTDYDEILIEYFVKNSYNFFNDIELSNLIKIVEEYFKSNESLLKRIFQIIKKKYSNKIIYHLKLLQQLNISGKILYVNDKLNKNIAIKIAQLKESEQKAVINLITSLKLNNNKQKICFNMLLDLSKRYSLDIASVLEKNFRNILDNSYTRDMEEKFFSTLLKLHSPNFYNYNNKFEAFKKELKIMKKGINLYSPTFYEDDNLKLELYFKNFNQLESKLKKLIDNIEKVKEKGLFNEFFN